MISPKKVLYIKLGREGEWEKECIEEKNWLRFGYREVSNENCINAKWDRVREEFEGFVDNRGAVTRHLNQVKEFYEADSDVLWITFYARKMWWCFSEPKVDILSDKTKVRKVIERWSCDDAEGNTLTFDRLSGALQSTQSFQGTICSFGDPRYVVDKINGLVPKDVEEAQTAYNELVRRVELIIRRLHWKDFEILVDLVFRQAGWKRIGELGGTQKTIDLELISPITREKFAVSIKSRATMDEFEKYREDFAYKSDYTKCYFVVHTPAENIESISTEGENVQLILPHQLAKLAVEYGLADWIISKSA